MKKRNMHIKLKKMLSKKELSKDDEKHIKKLVELMNKLTKEKE